MKLISLNTWGGKLYQPLIKFIKENSDNTDIFCFQEIFKTNFSKKEVFGFRINLYEEIANILKAHQGYFAVSIDNYLVGNFQKHFTDYNLSSGLTIFAKKDLKIIDYGDFFLFGNKKSYNLDDFNSMPRNLQYISFITGGHEYTICNLHGIWLKEDKKDSPERLKQSKKIKSFLDGQDGKKILCGDFNLDISTKSIKILENNLRNLIKEYAIKTTRNKHFPGSEKFADYTFVSDDVSVENFTVPDIDISDHLPMIIEFS